MRTIKVNFTIQYTKTFDLDEDFIDDRDPQEILKVLEEYWQPDDIPNWAKIRLDWNGASWVNRYNEDDGGDSDEEQPF